MAAYWEEREGREGREEREGGEGGRRGREAREGGEEEKIELHICMQNIKREKSTPIKYAINRPMV